MILSKLYLSFCILTFMGTPSWAIKPTFLMNEEKPLTIQVTNQGPIRISVQGDRLHSVMGLEETVTFDQDETHGVLYIRGVTTPQTISITTEGGLFQDITLEPKEGGTSHVVMVPPMAPLKGLNGSFDTQPYFPLSSERTPGLGEPDRILVLMKQLSQGLGVEEVVSSLSNRTTAYGLVAKPIRGLFWEDKMGAVFAVQNESNTTHNLLEKDFYERGDQALSLDKQQLEPGETTYLRVVCERKPS